MSLQIEAGKYYKNKLGDVCGPMQPNPDKQSHYEWQCQKGHETFTANGRWYSLSATSDRDLQSECDAQGNPVKSNAPRNHNLMDQGKYYRSYDGVVYGPMGMYTGPGAIEFFCNRTHIVFLPDGTMKGAQFGDTRNLSHECDAQGNPKNAPAAVPPTANLGFLQHSRIRLTSGKYYLGYDGVARGPMTQTITSAGSMFFVCLTTGLKFESVGYAITGSYPTGMAPSDLSCECDQHGRPLSTPAVAGGMSSSGTVPITNTGSLPGHYVVTGSGGGAGGATISSAPPKTPDLPKPAEGNIVDRALAAQKKAEQTELERQQALPSAEERLKEYQRNVAKLFESGNLY